MFLEQEHKYEVAEKICQENFLMKLAYLSDIFGKLNEINLQLQGKDKHIPQVADKISSFTRKLAMWERRLDEGNTDSFKNLHEFRQQCNLSDPKHQAAHFISVGIL